MQFVRMVFRLYRRRPAFSVASTLSIALGMSLAIAVLAVTSAILLRPLPVREADRVATVFVPIDRDIPHRFALLEAIQNGASAVDHAAAYSFSRVIVGRSGSARTLVAAQVSPGFFHVAGIRPVLGSDFDASAAASDGRSVLISHSLWVGELGSDTAIVGKSLLVGAQPRTILGVLPSGFDLPGRASIWLHLDVTPLATSNGGSTPYFIIARLAPSGTLGALQTQVSLLSRRLGANDARPSASEPRVYGLREYLTASLREQLQLWTAIAIVVLALCAVNFATMSFARGMSRSHEIALERALGASVHRVAGSLVKESLGYSLVGGALAVLFAWWLIRFATSLLSDSAITVAPRLDWPLALLGILGTAIVGAAFALLPAIESARVDIRNVLQCGASGSTTPPKVLRSRKALVGLQIAMALTATALVTALALADRRFQRAEIGIDYSRLVTASVFNLDPADSPIDLRSLLERLDALNTVDAAAAYNACAEAAARRDDESQQAAVAVACTVTPRYFRTLGVRQVAGRLPTTDEVIARAPVVVLARSLASRLFGSANLAIGKEVQLERSGWHGATRVVGVVENIGDALFGFDPMAFRTHDIVMHENAVLMVRSRGTPHAAISGLGDLLQSENPRLLVSDVSAAEDAISRGRVRAQGRAYFLFCVAAIAVLLAVIGVFGLTTYSTGLRTREFGIRLAVGASPERLVWLVLQEFRWSAALGLLIGLAASLRLTAWLDAIVRPPHMTDPLVTMPLAALIVSAGALALILLIGMGVPMRRILKLDVVRSIRS